MSVYPDPQIISVLITFMAIPAFAIANDHFQYTTCRQPFQCGNISGIGFPFWGAKRPSYCGFPGFNLTCSAQVASIRIDKLSFQVLQINNLKSTIKVARTDYTQNICPEALRNTTMVPNIFNYTDDTQNVTIYYGCPATGINFPPGTAYPFTCNSVGGYFLTGDLRSSLASEDASTIMDFLTTCDANVTVLANQSVIQSMNNNASSTNLVANLNQGFGVEWNANSSMCTYCSRSGGQCGYNQSTRSFTCYCPDQPYNSICPPGTDSNQAPPPGGVEFQGPAATLRGKKTFSHLQLWSGWLNVFYTGQFIALTGIGSNNIIAICAIVAAICAIVAAIICIIRVCKASFFFFTRVCKASFFFFKRVCKASLFFFTIVCKASFFFFKASFCFFTRVCKASFFFFTRVCKVITIWCKKMKPDENIDLFIMNYQSIVPQQYSYSAIKKMTNSFADKLGQGGFGIVYKGRLSDDSLVAVKILNNSNSNGEAFINEVVSTARASHVNVVALLGFCYERTKRALIYEYMPNGSLDKFICNQQSPNTGPRLEWKTLYEIAVGIARGLEYLHRGCNTRIVHFDIKPHNILLDQDFCPKISDFGLAKLSKGKESKVSMSGMRGTAGYIAPELVCRNFGGVSYKSDVYSYGMMVLEMVGAKQNVNIGASESSEVYFPDWIYKQLEPGEISRLRGGITEDEEETIKKMILVGLWCVQTNPSDRPSMTKVVEMLEGSLESLQFPPKSFLSSPEMLPLEYSSATSSQNHSRSQMDEDKALSLGGIEL